MFVCLLLCQSALFADDPVITLHTKAESCPVSFTKPIIAIANDGILTLQETEVKTSFDRGKTWTSKPAVPADKFSFAGDLSLVRTSDGTIVCVFCNGKETKSGGKWGEGKPSDWVMPVYSIFSKDNGATWSEPLLIQRDWVGALRAMVVLKSGRIVLATMAIVPWHHVIPVYYSDDQGQSWTKTTVVDVENSKINDHDGALEPKLVQLNDGSIFMLIRTTKGTFYKSISTDEGLTWTKPESTGIQNNNSFGELNRLADGRLILLWNRDENLPPFNYVPDPNDWIVKDLNYDWLRPRNILAASFSSDDGKTWTPPVTIASTTPSTSDMETWICYPLFFEPEPGVFWIATGEPGATGCINVQIKEEDLLK